MTIELSKQERGLLAIALLGLGERQRNVTATCEAVVALAERLNVLEELRAQATGWLAHVEALRAARASARSATDGGSPD